MIWFSNAASTIDSSLDFVTCNLDVLPLKLHNNLASKCVCLFENNRITWMRMIAASDDPQSANKVQTCRNPIFITQGVTLELNLSFASLDLKMSLVSSDALVYQ